MSTNSEKMNLTKEEYLKALNELVTNRRSASRIVRNKYIIEQLIDEYFKLKRMLETFK